MAASVQERHLGVLADGTPYFVPLGRTWSDDRGLCCHLCGGWYRSVAAHLRAHGWTRQAYLDVFGLEQGTALECASTRRRRSASFVPRTTDDPRVRDGIELGHALARSGQLAAHAAKAQRGRRHPAQRRAKTLAALATVSPERRAEGTRLLRRTQLLETAHLVALRFGFSTLDAYVADRLSRGDSLAAASREAGLHANWLQRHLEVVAPEAAGRLDEHRDAGADARWLPVVTRLGYDDVPAYLRERHVRERRTVHAIAVETGFSRDTVVRALRRHGLGAA